VRSSSSVRSRGSSNDAIKVSPFPVLPLPPLPSLATNQETAATAAAEENLQLFSSVLEQRKRVWSTDSKISSEGREGRKLTVGERLRLLVDPGSEILEIGTLAGLNMPYGDVCHGNNIVCVVRVCGEACVVSASDWTFKGGTAYPISVKKQLRAQEIVLANRLPCIYFVDSGGAFLPLQVLGLFAVI
jgi:3-methylcrotonyl-CoA carboxylase beta subunit